MQTAPPKGRGAEGEKKETQNLFLSLSRHGPQDVPAELLELTRQRAARRLHKLGARPMLEAMLELANGADLDSVLCRYAAINATTLRALGGDRFAPPPLCEVAS